MSYDDVRLCQEISYRHAGRSWAKFPQGVPLDNIGQYWTVVCNAWQYQEILNNIYIIIGQYLNIPKNIITTQKIESWNNPLNNIEQYQTIFDNIVQQAGAELCQAKHSLS